LTAALAELGCHVTTVDHADRGAAQNLTGLRVKVVQSDAAEFLVSNKRRYDLIVCDLHGNSEEDWEPLAQPLLKALSAQGSIILNNYRLYTDPEWAFERGVAQFVAHLPPNFEVQEIATAHPGVVKVSQI
jgi:spermidine synthase